MVAGERGEALSMRWLALVGAVASAFITTAAFAEVHIVNDPGGEVSEYVQKVLDRFHRTRSGSRRSAPPGMYRNPPCWRLAV